MSSENPILDALQVSIILNRRDKSGQTAWTEWRDEIVLVGGTPAQAGDLALLGPDGKFDPSVIPGGGSSTVYVNGTPITNPDFNNTAPAAPAGYSNVIWQFDGSGNVSAYYSTSGITAVPFSEITSGPNTTATMIVGAGATLTYAASGSPATNGIVDANYVGGVDAALNAPAHAGQTLVSQTGNTSAMWEDPIGLMTLIAGEDITAFQTVSCYADGLGYVADAGTLADANRFVGIAITSATTGFTFQVQQIGAISGGYNFSPGASVYLGLDGALTQDPNTGLFELPLGVALSSGVFALQVGMPIIFA